MPRTTHDERMPAAAPERVLVYAPRRIDERSELMRRELARRRAQVERAIEAARHWRSRATD